MHLIFRIICAKYSTLKGHFTPWRTAATWLMVGLFISGCAPYIRNPQNSVSASIAQDPSDNFELNQSWTPEWANLAGYWKFNGALGTIANGAIIPTAIGPHGTAEVSGNVYCDTGQLNQSIFLRRRQFTTTATFIITQTRDKKCA